jgi:TonB family protein
MFIFQIDLFSQIKAYVEGYPVVGWDSLKSLIVYPLIARRGGIQGYAEVSVQIDSLGNATEVTVNGYHFFEQSIREAVKKVKWVSAQELGNPHQRTANFEIQFHLKQHTDRPTQRLLIIEDNVPKVDIQR